MLGNKLIMKIDFVKNKKYNQDYCLKTKYLVINLFYTKLFNEAYIQQSSSHQLANRLNLSDNYLSRTSSQIGIDDQNHNLLGSFHRDDQLNNNHFLHMVCNNNQKMAHVEVLQDNCQFHTLGLHCIDYRDRSLLHLLHMDYC